MSFDGAGGGGALGSARGEIIISTDAAERAVKQLQGTVTSFGDSSAAAFNRVATGLGLLAVSKGILGAFGGMVGVAVDLEAAMSGVSAALGGVGNEAGITEEQFAALNKEALRIGAETSKSAGEAAVAMELLARAGIDAETILNGAAQGAVNLSEATGEGLQQSSETMAAMILLFQDTGITAERATDIITTGMNNSNATMSEFQTGMARLAPTIAGTGLSMEEAAAAIAFFNAQGLSAAEAGSSLNSAFLALANPTAEAAAAMEQYGIAAFDAQGNFIGFPALMDNVNQALSGVTSEADRAAILTTIFGRDALDVMTIGAKNGGAALRDLGVDMEETGTAAAASAERMDNLAGDVEELRGTLESISARIGAKVIPVLRDLAQGATLLARGFAALPDSFQVAAVGAVALSGALAGIAGVMVLAGPRMGEFSNALRTARAALISTNPLLLALVGGIALFAAAYKTNFGGFADFVDGVARRVAGAFQSIRDNLHLFTTDFAGVQVRRGFGRALGFEDLDRFQTLLQRMGRTFNKFRSNLRRVEREFGRLSRIFKRGGLVEGLQATFGDVGLGIVQNFVKAIAAVPETIGVALRGIRTGFAPLDRAFYDVGRSLQFFGGAIEEFARGNITGAFDKLVKSVGSLFDAAIGLGEIALSIGSWAISAAVDIGTAVYDWITETAWPAVRDNAAEILDAAVSIGSWAIRAGASLWDAISDTVGAAWELLKGIAVQIPDVLLSIGSFLIAAGTSIWDAVSDAVSAAWDLVKGLAVDLKDVALNVLTFAVRAGASIWDTVSSAIATAWDLVRTRAVPLAEAVVEFSEVRVQAIFGWAADVVPDIQAWIDSHPPGSFVTVINLTDFEVAFAEGAEGNWGQAVRDLLTADPIQVTPEIELRISEGFENAVRDVHIEPITIAKWAAIIPLAFINLPIALGVFLTKTLGPDLLRIIRGAFTGIFEGLFQDETVFGPGTGAITKRARLFDPDRLSEALFGNLNDLADTIAEKFGELDFSDIPIPPIPDWFTDFGWFTDPIDGLIDEIEKQIGRLSDAWDKLAFWKDRDPNFNPLAGVGGDRPTVPGRNVPPKPPGDNWFWTGSEWIQPYSPIPDVPDKQPFMDFGASLGGSIGQGVVDGIEASHPDVTAALAALAGGGADARNTDFRPPEPVKIPAPDLSRLLAGLVRAVQAVSAIATPMGAAGRTAGESFATGIRTGMDAAVSATATGVVQIRNAAAAIGSLYGAGVGVGISLGQGIAAGIRSMIGVVSAESARLVYEALQAAKRAGGIASPSKLMRDQIGLPLAQGVALGIEQGAPLAQRSLSSLLGGLVPTTSSTAMLGRQPVGASAAAGGGASTVVIVNALKSDELTRLLQQAERGDISMANWENVSRSFGLVMGA